MTAEKNRELVINFFHQICRGNFERFDETFAANLILHIQSPYASKEPGSKGFKKTLEAEIEAMPDLTLTVQDTVAEPDRVAARVIIRSTPKHANGKKIEIDDMTFFRFDNGRIVEIWGVVDRLGAMEQLGAWPPRGAPHA